MIDGFETSGKPVTSVYLEEFEKENSIGLDEFEHGTGIGLDDIPRDKANLLMEFEQSNEIIDLDEVGDDPEEIEELIEEESEPGESIEDEEEIGEEVSEEELTSAESEVDLTLDEEEEELIDEEDYVEPPEFEDWHEEDDAPSEVPGGPVIGFVCEHGLDTSGITDRDGTMTGYNHVNIIKLPCAGMVKMSWVIESIQKGCEGIFVVSCSPENCYHRRGGAVLCRRWENFREPMILAGCDPSRIRLIKNYRAARSEILEEIESFLTGIRELKIEIVAGSELVSEEEDPIEDQNL